ncbi:hypothetical protein B9Z55_027145 [Caenorhabditis nigoni]|uniref:Uncharacterized protein n=1 Tax=Caenorhabditis nigoni TaxID=1611254 RepID=A0A2G5SGT5_9PELO|nr:hypothetical protein B9Z55_027145 [Caenorhabditis nigoni]
MVLVEIYHLIPKPSEYLASETSYQPARHLPGPARLQLWRKSKKKKKNFILTPNGKIAEEYNKIIFNLKFKDMPYEKVARCVQKMRAPGPGQPAPIVDVTESGFFHIAQGCRIVFTESMKAMTGQTVKKGSFGIQLCTMMNHFGGRRSWNASRCHHETDRRVRDGCTLAQF